MELRHAALQALRLADPPAKVAAVQALWQAVGSAPLEPSVEIAGRDDIPGRPSRPALVNPARVPRRSPHTTAGRAALLHAIAHIEFNAINLALDAVWRFAGLPAAYYRDWLRVADEDALHFTLLREHLRALGHDYVLALILRDEIGHAAIGNCWYRWACARGVRSGLTQV